jgi:hypothetical protein
MRGSDELDSRKLFQQSPTNIPLPAWMKVKIDLIDQHNGTLG